MSKQEPLATRSTQPGDELKNTTSVSFKVPQSDPGFRPLVRAVYPVTLKVAPPRFLPGMSPFAIMFLAVVPVLPVMVRDHQSLRSEY